MIAVAWWLGCTHTPKPITNTASSDPRWQDRLRELCAALGSDNRGLDGVALHGVTVGAEGKGWGASGDYHLRTWKIAAPSTLHAVGIVGKRTHDGDRIVAVWVETGATPRDTCAALHMPLSRNGCERIDGNNRVSVSIEKTDTDTRVECEIAVTIDL